jgi:hypothetical protein
MVRHLGTEIFIALANKKMSQIKHSNTTNILHRRQLHIMRQVNRKMMMMMIIIIIIITKADKGRTVVIIDKDVYQEKVKTLVQDNHFTKT